MSAAFRNHLEQSAAGVFVLLVRLQMFGELINLLGQERHLHGRRASVLLMDPARADQFLFLLS